jgi:amino acid transporter/nucleotide-binding universal stress UspA family protein
LINGLIALITVLSFAELSSAFPQSGGTYLFAKRVLSVGAAFNVGWIVWFASIVAAGLYALGFSSFMLGSVAALWEPAQEMAAQGWVLSALAIGTVILSGVYLCRFNAAGGDWINILKVLVFTVLILGGFVIWAKDRPPLTTQFEPFMPFGTLGLLQAMGFTFIAMQGFDLIAAVAGEVKEPRRVLPRAMMFSLGIALLVYIPLLVVVIVVGVPQGTTVTEMAQANPDTIIALAAREYLGQAGFWLVMASGILSMLSAMLANMFAASRIGLAMAEDRTLPWFMEHVSRRHGTPIRAVLMTTTLIVIVLLFVRDVSSAGAASSLIFLISFGLTHFICFLARKRRPNHNGFRTPMYPYLPLLGMGLCFALAVFQGFSVPSAGLITGGWLVGGFFVYTNVLGNRARTLDAASEIADPELLELRGRSPLALVPIGNPSSAKTLALLASCLSPAAGRVLLLNIVRPPSTDLSLGGLPDLGQILERSMMASVSSTVPVECLATFSSEPMIEIERVANAHQCALTLMGMSDLSDDATRQRLEGVLTKLPGNVAVLRSPAGWEPLTVRHVLVPFGGHHTHNALRARLLTALAQRVPGTLRVSYMIVVPDSTSEKERATMQKIWRRLVADESSAEASITVQSGSDPASVIASAATDADLVILGLGRHGGEHPIFGPFITKVVCATDTPILVIGQNE